MLKGRETLSRLVGKRRKILPNRQALLSAKRENSLDHQTDQNVGMPCSTAAEGSSMVGSCIYGTGGSGKGVDEVCSGSDWVTCPVCGNDVQGSAYIINAHLDACLVRGKKRKMAQSTLLQLKFCSRSQDRVCPSELSTLEASVSHKCPDDIPVQDTVCLESCSTLKSDVKVSDQNFTSKEVISYEGVTSSPPPNIHMPKLDSGGSIEDKSAAFLETFIVGRRFSDELDLKQGASVSLQRDPDNAKDPNAIKVLSNTGCPKVLGFLPRDLARYLSPLIQKYCLRFEGSVTSLPKHPLDVVPIRIMCQDMTPHQEKETNDFQVYNSLWSNAIRTVEYAKSFPPSMTKYQRNFSLLVQEVLKNDHHLFTDDEKLFLESFGSLSDDSQRLFVRLYTRKGPWFRMSNISYPEILDSKQAMTSLSESGYIQAIETTKQLHENDMEEVMDLLTVSELREILNLTFLKNGIRCTRRQDLIMSLLSSFKDGMCPQLWNLVLDLTGTCVRISSMAEYLLWRVQRLFFLNGEQDLSAFLLVDLGLVKYPVYNCSVANQTFPSRSDLLAYEEAVEVAQIMDESLDENNSDVVLRCIKISDAHISSSPGKVNQSSFPESSGIFLTCFSALWVYSNVVMLGISFLEHERRYDDAISHLQRLLVRFTCDGRRGYWALRLSINLEHIHRLNESLCVAEEGLLDPWVRAGSKMALQRRVLRLGKPPRRWKIPSFAKSITRKIKEVHIRGRPLNCETGMKNRFYGEDGEQCGVEQLALQYYAGEGGGWQGVHTESGIWLTIFGLLMWDIIFADIPDVFRTRFQTAPLDLETDNFYMVRKNLIECHLQKIRGGMAEEILITSWESHLGTACRGVNWDRHSLFDLRAAVTCIGGPCLASLCCHLAQDYRSWSSGMPDLLLWRFCGEYTGEAKLVEVKGPKDHLSEQQRAWLLLLTDCGFSAEVCKVSPAPQVT